MSNTSAKKRNGLWLFFAFLFLFTGHVGFAIAFFILWLLSS